MTANRIDRRAALTVVVAAPAALALASPAIAGVGEDAELLRLWEEWNAQFARCGEANKISNDEEG
jgi:hypothetical protein